MTETQKSKYLLSIGLGTPLAVVAHTSVAIKKHYKINKTFDPSKGEELKEIDPITKEVKITKNDKFIVEEIDSQEAINSVHKTTFDYLLEHDASSPRVKNTMERLASIAKSEKGGILYDSHGREIISSKDATANKIKLQEELILLKKESESVLANATATKPAVKPIETPSPSQPNESEVK